MLFSIELDLTNLINFFYHFSQNTLVGIFWYQQKIIKIIILYKLNYNYLLLKIHLYNRVFGTFLFLYIWLKNYWEMCFFMLNESGVIWLRISLKVSIKDQFRDSSIRDDLCKFMSIEIIENPFRRACRIMRQSQIGWFEITVDIANAIYRHTLR